MGATHIRALRTVPGARLAAVVSSDLKKLSGDLSGVWGNISSAGEVMDFSGQARYQNVAECLNDPNVDAVDICVPTDLHEEVTRAALRAGKHVLVEKPIALDGESADRMIEEARRADRVLMCGQVLRFFPQYRAAAEKLPSLGRVRSAAFRRKCGVPGWSPWLRDPARSGGAVMDLLIHDADYMAMLFGLPESVSATGYTDIRHGIDWMVANFEYRGVGPVSIEGGWYYPESYPFSMDFTIEAEGGKLDYGSLTPDGPEVDGYAEELAYFVECASRNRQPERCPPADSARAVRLMRSMLESRKRNGERVTCSISE
jgi:predicted dehydrogenase